MKNRRLKQNKSLRKSCELLLEEKEYVQNSINFLTKNGGSQDTIDRFQRHRDYLDSLCELARCPVEDTSPEALKANRKLLGEVRKEIK